MATLNVNYPVKYLSESMGKWVDTHVSQVATDGSIEVHCKPGLFQHIHNFNGKLKLKNDQPLPDDFVRVLQSHPTVARTRAPEPLGTQASIHSTPNNHDQKRTRTDTGGVLPLQFSMTADAVPALPPGIASGAPTRHNIPAGAGISAEQMQAMLAQQAAVINGNTDGKVACLELKMGQRITVIETKQAEHDTKFNEVQEHDEKQDHRIDALEKQMSALGRSSSMPANLRIDPENDKKAFLGGFPQKRATTIKASAENFVGNPDGFVKAEVFGNISTGAILIFASPEIMNKYIVDNESRAKDAGYFLKPNRGPVDPAERIRKNLIWQGKQALIKKGVPEEKAVFSRGRFWIAELDGSVKEVGKLNGNTIDWNETAPDGVAGA